MKRVAIVPTLFLLGFASAPVAAPFAYQLPDETAQL
jgi:hypothetical protein